MYIERQTGKQTIFILMNVYSKTNIDEHRQKNK